MAQKISRRLLAKAIAAQLADPKINRKRLAKLVAAYLIAHKQTEQLELLIGDIARIVAQQHGHVFATVTSARELSSTLRYDVARHLRGELQAKSVELATATDRSLLGGIIINAPGAQLDGSVRHKLKALSGSTES